MPVLITPDDWVLALHARYLNDLNRLSAAGVLAPAQAARLGQVAHRPLHRLMIAAEDGPAADLAGFFIVIESGGSTCLFSPVDGLEVFASAPLVGVALEQRLADPLRREDILRFVPIEVRGALVSSPALSIRRVVIETPVFEVLADSIDALRVHNLELLRARLLEQPSLRGVAPEDFKAAIEAYWDTDIEGLSLREVAIQCAGDHFFNELMQARHNGLIDPGTFAELKVLCSSTASASSGIRPAQLSLLDQDTGEVELVGLFDLQLPAREGHRVLFSQSGGLHVFEQTSTLREYLLARLMDPRALSHLLDHVSLDHQGMLKGMYNVILEATVIAGSLFASCVQSVINKQWRDTQFLMTTVKGTQRDLNAVADHGLDVRRLLDPRLLGLSNEGRWSTALALQRQATPTLAAPDIHSVQQIDDKLTSLEALLARILSARPGLRDFALQQLTVQLVAAGKPHLDPRDLMVQTHVSYALSKQPNPLSERSLVDTLLEQVTGCHPLPNESAYLRLSAQRNNPELKPVDSLEGAPLQALLERAAVQFARGFSQQLRGFYARVTQPLPGLGVSRELAQLKGTALRYEVQIKHFARELQDLDVQLINTVLDRPLRSERRAVNGFSPDVCTLSLLLAGRVRSITLSNCFVITERGGTDPVNSGCAILWTTANGFERFADLAACEQRVHSRLVAPDQRWSLMGSIHRRDHEVVLERLATVQWVFNLSEDHWLEACQGRVIEQLITEADLACVQAIAHHFSARSFVEQVSEGLRPQQAGLDLAGVRQALRNHLFNDALPDWLKTATPDERQDYAELLLRFRQANASGLSYTQDVPELLEYAREQLTLRLQADFPTEALAPDAIEVSVVQYSAPAGGEIAGPAATSRLTHTLTYFALSNFIHVQEGLRSYRSTGGQRLPEGFNDAYVRSMVRALDLPASYQALLSEKLAPGQPGVAQRQALFSQQLPPQLLEQALQASLTGALGKTAYQYLKHVFNSPDAKARELFEGIELVFRPLAFRALEGRHPDIARGLYLIGPASLDAGPQVLYVLLSAQYSLKEFSDQHDVMAFLKGNTHFQALVLERLEPRVRKIYAHNGFDEPHIGYVDPTLSSALEPNPPAVLVTDPVRGNCLNTLYADTFQVRLAQAKAHSQTVAEADWRSLQYLLWLLADIALFVLPGRLNVPLLVWNSVEGVQASFEAASEDRWGQALFEFANALLLLDAGRAALKPSVRVLETGPEVPELHGPLQTREQPIGLRPYEVHDLALADLREDLASGFYTQVETGQQYVAVQGRVYRAVPWRDRWRIYIGDEAQGPLIKRDDRQRWVIDPHEPLLGGGVAGSRLARVVAVPLFNRTLNISAFGMRNIRRLYPDKARIIRLAHEQAIHYLSECQEHLQSLRSARDLNSRTRSFLQEFFSVSTIGEPLLTKLKTLNERLLAFIQHSDYSPYDSKRYAICDLTHLNATAMAGVAHPQKPIFLNGRFFNNRDYSFAPIIRTENGRAFDTNKHFTGTTLIHEFSHLALRTFDINYVLSYWPFEELLVRDDAEARVIRDMLQRARGEQLTTRIQAESLFRDVDYDSAGYKALEPDVETQLLERTGLHSLEAVQRKFLNDADFRADVILMNADSVSYLLTWLGFFKPPPAVATGRVTPISI